MRAAVVTGLVAAALLVGCTDPVDPPTADPPRSTTATSPSASPSTEPPPPAPGPITLAFAGDVHFEGVLHDRLEDPATALAPVTSALAAADLAVVNLETSVGVGGSPDPTKRFTFQAPPSAFDALAAVGIDVATMANNHALDYGRAALPSTFAAIDRAPISVVGLGRDAREAFAPALSDVDGTVVATIGATVADLDPTADPTGRWAATATRPGTADAVDPRRLLRAVARADRDAAVVLVYMHWGTQGERCPTDAQRSLAAELVERGADVVVGSHAHVVQGAGAVGQGYVAYGLGNFAWYQPSDTGVLTLTVRPPTEPIGRATVTDASWEPARIGTSGLPVAVGGTGRLDPPC